MNIYQKIILWIYGWISWIPCLTKNTRYKRTQTVWLVWCSGAGRRTLLGGTKVRVWGRGWQLWPQPWGTQPHDAFIVRNMFLGLHQLPGALVRPWGSQPGSYHPLVGDLVTELLSLVTKRCKITSIPWPPFLMCLLWPSTALNIHSTLERLTLQCSTIFPVTFSHLLTNCVPT